ncbi:hypothetical protein ACIBP6_30185 [Nonomuraea terrae]|uniref:hypothetical protein n=1 Tax=Nonomuraea terrae TaxID=2530383 RepID=UPI0037B68B66
MKRTITILAACSAVLAAAVPTQAASKEPVRALEAKLAPGHGVRFTGTTTFGDGTEERPVQKRKGTFAFGKKGVEAFDVTTERDQLRERVIKIGGIGHFCDIDPHGAPKGKIWYRYPRAKFGLDEQFSFYGQVISPAEPATLSALIENGDLSADTITGTITVAELKKVSPWFALSMASELGGGTEISYTLTLTSANLVSRVESTYRLPDHRVVHEDDQGMTVHADTRYSGWGDKVSIKAPDPDTVGDKIEGLPRLPGSYKLRSCQAT